MKITLSILKKEIKRQYRRIRQDKQYAFNFLGFVENKELSPEVEKLFTFKAAYDWVNGNEKMKKLIEETIS